MIVSSPPQRKFTRRRFLRGAVGLGGMSVCSVAWGAVEVNWLEVNPVELVLPHLTPAFDGFRIAQISDIHIEGADIKNRLPEISHYISAQKVDAIFLTGDFTTSAGDWQEEPLVAGLKPLSAASGVFGVLGNHDQWEAETGSKGGAELARSVLKRIGAVELNNSVFPLERDGATLWICGVDDWLTGHAELDTVTAALPRNSCAILLAHEPDFADEVAATGRFDLMLSGHSHGGQIAMPFFGPIHLPPGGRKYPCGRYQIGEMIQYTNRGLGVIEIPLRFCARPELTIFTLKAGASVV
jgi:predicted MPP superfamily phosphohydrolase